MNAKQIVQRILKENHKEYLLNNKVELNYISGFLLYIDTKEKFCKIKRFIDGIKKIEENYLSDVIENIPPGILDNKEGYLLQLRSDFYELDRNLISEKENLVRVRNRIEMFDNFLYRSITSYYIEFYIYLSFESMMDLIVGL